MEYVVSKVPTVSGMYLVEVNDIYQACFKLLNSVEDASCFIRIKKRMKKKINNHTIRNDLKENEKDIILNEEVNEINKKKNKLKEKKKEYCCPYDI